MRVISVCGLVAGFGAHQVLRGLDLGADPGEVVALVGVNGTGKSTLLRCLAGLHRYEAGEVEVLGGPPADDQRFWRSVGLLGDEPSWYPGLTVREHLELIRLAHEPVPPEWPPVDELLAEFGLTDQADATPLVLSTGQRQRLSLLTVLVRPSVLLLLDEPEHGLDPDFRVRLGARLRTYARDGRTVVMASHDPVLLASAGGRQVRVDAGKAVPVSASGER